MKSLNKLISDKKKFTTNANGKLVLNATPVKEKKNTRHTYFKAN